MKCSLCRTIHWSSTGWVTLSNRLLNLNSIDNRLCPHVVYVSLPLLLWAGHSRTSKAQLRALPIAGGHACPLGRTLRSATPQCILLIVLYCTCTLHIYSVRDERFIMFTWCFVSLIDVHFISDGGASVARVLRHQLSRDIPVHILCMQDCVYFVLYRWLVDCDYSKWCFT